MEENSKRSNSAFHVLRRGRFDRAYCKGLCLKQDAEYLRSYLKGQLVACEDWADSTTLTRAGGRLYFTLL